MLHNGAVDEALFEIPLWAELLAVGVGALQGALFAAYFKERHLDLLGVAIIGVATGLGGGILRDLVLSVQVASFQSNWYLLVAVAAALVGMALERIFTKLNTFIMVVDALNLGLFAAIGTTKAIALGLPVVPAAPVGVLTAVGGSILRDVLIMTPVELFKVAPFYATAAIAGTTTLVGMSMLGANIGVAAGVCVLITFTLRVLAMIFKWSIPEQRRIERLPIPRRRPRQDGTPAV